MRAEPADLIGWPPRSNPLIRKLTAAGDLTDDDLAILTQICAQPRRVAAGEDIISYGDAPSDVHLVLDGFAYRYKLLPDGSRQIVALLLPGDFCDLHGAILGRMDHSIGALTACTIVDISVETVRDLTERHSRITRAFWWATLVDEGVLREWLTNMGQREAPERMAHLICELLVRLQLVGLADEDGYHLPLTQEHLVDVMGLTAVHVNRTVRTLREEGMIVLARSRLTISDVARLKAFCDFDPAYLHLDGP